MLVKFLPLVALFSLGAKALVEGENQLEQAINDLDYGHQGPRMEGRSGHWGRSGSGRKGEHKEERSWEGPVNDWVIPKGEWKEHKDCKVCPVHSEEFVVVHTHVPRCDAEAVCERMGMTLANINSWNFNEASNIAYKCSGANSQTWINSWNGDEYRGSCIAFSTGSTCGGGAINTPRCCSERLPVMCQKKRCHRHEHKMQEHGHKHCHHKHHHEHCHRHHRKEESSSETTSSSSSESSDSEEYYHGGRGGRHGFSGEEPTNYRPTPLRHSKPRNQCVAKDQLVGLYRQPQSMQPKRHHSHGNHCHHHRRHPHRRCCLGRNKCRNRDCYRRKCRWVYDWEEGRWIEKCERLPLPLFEGEFN